MLNNDFKIVLNLSKDRFMNQLMPYLYFRDNIELNLGELKNKKYLAKLKFNQFELRSIHQNRYTYSFSFGESIIGEIEEIDSNKTLILGEVKINLWFEMWIAIMLIISILFSADENGIIFTFIFLIFNLIQTYHSIKIAKRNFIAFLKSL